MSPLAAITIAAVTIGLILFSYAACVVSSSADLRTEVFDSLRQDAAERPDVAMLVQRGFHSIHNGGDAR